MVHRPLLAEAVRGPVPCRCRVRSTSDSRVGALGRPVGSCRLCAARLGVALTVIEGEGESGRYSIRKALWLALIAPVEMKKLIAR